MDGVEKMQAMLAATTRIEIGKYVAERTPHTDDRWHVTAPSAVGCYEVGRMLTREEAFDLATKSLEQDRARGYRPQ